MLQQELMLPWEDRRHRRGYKRRRKDNVHQYIQYIKYGAGIAAGITVVGWIKRKLQGIPVVGILATPFLCLMPTVLLGTAVGAAVVYGIDEGDPLAAQKKVLPKVQKSIKSAHKEVKAAASEVSRSIRDIHKQHVDTAELAARESEAAVSRFAKSLDRAAAEAETSLAPTLQRHANNAKRQIDRHLNTAAEEYNRWLSQQQTGSSTSPRAVLLLASGTESD